MPVRCIATLADVDELVASILDPARSDPMVAVTTRNREPEPLIDAEALARTLAPLPVQLVPTGDLTRHLTASLPDLLGVFGGAARIWKTGLAPTDDPLRHPLIFCDSPEEAPRAVQRLQAELERQAWQESTYLVRQSALEISVAPPDFAVGSELVGTVVEAQPYGGEVELAPGIRAWLVRR